MHHCPYGDENIVSMFRTTKIFTGITHQNALRNSSLLEPPSLRNTTSLHNATMPRPPWADDDRLKFMRDSMPAYEAAQECKKTRIFLGKMHEEYFEKFPQKDETLLAFEKDVREPYYASSHT